MRIGALIRKRLPKLISTATSVFVIIAGAMPT